MVKKRRVTLLNILLIFSLFVFSGCKFKWFEDFGEKIREDIYVECRFYKNYDLDSEYFTKLYRMYTQITLPAANNSEVQALNKGFELKGWTFMQTEEGLNSFDGLLINDGYVVAAEIESNALYFYGDWDYGISEYKVKHLFESLNDETLYIEDPKYPTETCYGTTMDYTNAIAKEVPGFVNSTITQKQIEADGSTVVIIEYNRKQITLTVIAEDAANSPQILSGKYGKTVDYEDIERQGYYIKNWNAHNDDTGEDSSVDELPETFPADNITYTAVWDGLTVYYYVQHMIETLSGTPQYEEYKRESFRGKVGTPATYELLDELEKGFIAQKITESYIISGDPENPTSIDIKYDRKEFEVNFLGGIFVNGTQSSRETTKKYEYTITSADLPEVSTFVPQHDGWEFDYWQYTDSKGDHKFSDELEITENVTFTIIWKRLPGISVTVSAPVYPENKDIEISYDLEQDYIYLLVNSDYDSYRWYVDGELLATTPNIGFTLNNRIGDIEVTVLVFTGTGEIYSGKITITVTKEYIK